ncbi:hypothetical protein GO986_07025 [Deinococcus sp. HMF7620]|uniref:Uncharacterized protein n=1 Tax=Deinococcus arboris TaxID=2682977 RepID=A0A7C9LMP7_9DEIO|nr:hypothetical protein [Deinococcus arboris]MVN86516.1 hypothetical protein [Deinococcus arboris]
MLDPLPDLLDYAALTDWSDQHEAKGYTYNDFIEVFLSQKTAIGYYRACIFALRIQPRPLEDTVEWLQQAYLKGDEMLRLMVLALRINANIRIPFLKGVAEANGPREGIVVLRGLWSEINKLNGHPLRLEAELRITYGLMQAHIVLGDTDQVDYLSLRLITLASLFEGSSLKSYYVTMRSGALAVNGHWSQSVEVLSQEGMFDETVGPQKIRMAAINLSNGLINLGALDAALSAIHRALEVQSADVMLRSQEQWGRALYGQSSPEESSLCPDLPLQAWQIEVMHLLARAEAMAPIGKALNQREHLLRSILIETERSISHDIFDGDLLFGQWLRGRTRLLLSEYGMVMQELTGLSEPLREELYNRALLAALNLELAMTPLETLHVPLKEAEQQFRNVFEDANVINYAAPEGLAALVGRWHPQAAAYAALMPQPIREFLPALDSILRVQTRVMWRNQAVPTPLVAHLTRLGLRVPTIGLSVGGNVAYQIARLGRKENGVSIWGPLVPALPLVVALLRGGEEHRLIARRAIQDFGLLPVNQQTDPEMAKVATLWKSIADSQSPLSEGFRALQQLN